MAQKKENEVLKKIADTLHQTVDQLIRERSSLEYTDDPQLVQREIIEYNSRMRIIGMEKFNKPSFICATSFYKSEKEMKAGAAQGALVGYVDQELAEKFLKALGYGEDLSEDFEVLQNLFSKFFVEIADNFRGKAESLLKANFIMSEPVSSHNNNAEGVAFNYDEYSKFEVNYFFWREKVLSFDVTLTSDPRMLK